LAENQYYYNTAEYRQKLEELEEQKEEIRAQKELEAAQKEKEVKLERTRLKKIFTKERCGAENIHFVLSLIDRAAFLRVELEHIEQQLRLEGVMDFFTQGLQTMWREHPLSKVHVQYTKNYKDVITKLESYGKQDSKPDENKNPLGSLIQKGAAARGKYGK
jgi:hypothetical protein